MSKKTAITPTREQDYPEWYQQVIKAAELAENSSVRGCMVIRPWGYALWENIQRSMDALIKALGHENIYCPLFIPLQYLEKEAAHVAGFAKECAVVTHHRLIQNSEGKLIPDGLLEEPLIVRPTSETIIGESFARWVQSYRDLPLLINQWANVVRWEMRTRLFLRTSEFLWQEGHTAHATAEEAQEEALRMLDMYADFARDYLAMPVIKGEKSEGERFPGAVNTYCIEAMMQDRKALQAGTSHFLGQNFARASNIQFLDQQGQMSHAWTTSWGSSTRLIGGLIMMHSDDDGFVAPPRIAPQHVVILPILHDSETQEAILAYSQRLAERLRQERYHGEPLRVKVDMREGRGGEKAWSWVKKGVPLRVEIGAKEVAQQVVYCGRRDKPYHEKQSILLEAFVQTVVQQLDEMQIALYTKAQQFLKENMYEVHSEKEFREFFDESNKTQSGFALAHWNGDPVLEAAIKQDLGVTIRCIPCVDGEKVSGRCIFTGKPSEQAVIFARAY